MKHRSGLFAVLAPLLLGLLFLPCISTAATLGQVDDFEDGTTQSWAGGSSGGPNNVATGGPTGLDDNYLEVIATGNPWGTYNTGQWSGDYTGIDGIMLWVNNFAGSDLLNLRIAIVNSSLSGMWTSTNGVALAAGSGWQQVTFGLGAADMTQTQGSESLASALSNVGRLLIRHDADPVSGIGGLPSVNITAGIDGITAVPEPSRALLLLAGGAFLALRRRR